MAKLYPGTLLEFERWFRTEEDCREYLLHLRWPNGFRCPQCGHSQAWQTKRTLLHCKSCQKNVSPTAGTIFHASHLSLRIWFRAIWWVTNQKNGGSALGLQQALGLGSYKTAWACLQKLRRAMVRPGRDQLSGSVEVDETIIGGRTKGAAGRYLLGKTLVAVAAEIRKKWTGRIRLEVIPDPTRKSLHGFIRKNIAPESRVITDGLQAYDGLYRFGYRHESTILKHKGNEASMLTLPRVHRVASLVKRWLLGTHQGRVSKAHLGYSLDEFTFRFNRRTSPRRGMLFYRLLQQAVAIEPVFFNQLVNNPHQLERSK